MPPTRGILFFIAHHRMKKMRISFNDQHIETTSVTLAKLLEERALLQKSGIAVAVNQEVIPKTLWPEKVLQSNDSILIITATQGG